MERTMISFNLPNIVSIGLMAAIFFAVATVVAQFVLRGSSTAAPSGMGSY
jgi:hypothetical protein